MRTAALTLPLETRSLDEGTREFTAIGVPYGPIYDMGWGYRERFERGAIDAADAVLVYQHVEPIGTITGTRDTDEGLEVIARISHTQRGDEVYTLIRDGVLKSMSIGFELIDAREDTVDGQTVNTITSARAVEFSVVLNPAYKDAKITNVREATPTPKGTPLMSNPTPEVTAEDLTEIRAHLADLDRRTALADAPAPAPAPDKRTAGEYIKAIASGDERAIETMNTIMTRAYQGGVLGDDALASTPTFMRDLTQIITDANPLSRHFATGALPMQGMTMEYTELKENTVTVGKQVKEGDDLATGKVSTKVKTADIETFGGGASLSFQEIQRARANMVDLTVRAMTAAAAKDAATNFHTAWEKQVKDATNAITISKALASLNYADIVAMLLDVNAAYQELGSSISGLIVDRATFLKLATLENSSGTPYMAVSGHGTGTIGTLTSDVLAGSLGNVAVIPDLKATSNRGEKVAGAFFNADAIRVHSSGLAHLQDDRILNLTRDLSVYYYSAIAPERPDLILPLKIGA
nr:MAG TPA: head maturation protease [Caudoviricetes sp.]